MLGHAHPDADVLGTLLALGLSLENRGWAVVYGGPHPVPAALDFLPGIERYGVLAAVEGTFDVAVLTDCPNPDRTEGLLDRVRRVARHVINIDHHPDNRRYGHVNWVDPEAAATGHPHRYGVLSLFERHPRDLSDLRCPGGLGCRSRPGLERALRAPRAEFLALAG
jgi:hypothetical protein